MGRKVKCTEFFCSKQNNGYTLVWEISNGQKFTGTFSLEELLEDNIVVSNKGLVVMYNNRKEKRYVAEYDSVDSFLNQIESQEEIRNAPKLDDEFVTATFCGDEITTKRFSNIDALYNYCKGLKRCH
jgi:hypothetical protein